MTKHDIGSLQELVKTRWDVIIIGAGIAGSSLALILAREKLQVLLVDQAFFPREKVCGGCLNGSALAALGQLGLAGLPISLGGKQVQSLRLQANGRNATVPLENCVSVSRKALDEALVNCCMQVGVTFRPGVRAIPHSREVSSQVVHLQNASEAVICRGRILILTHGNKDGTIARHSRIGAGVILEEAPQEYPENTVNMAIAQGGYVGGVHVENGRYCLAAALDPHVVKASGSITLAIAKLLRQAGMPEIPSLQHAHWKGTPLLTRRHVNVAGDHWFAVGDAAGYVEPFTGEGMAWALNGVIALSTIISSANGGWNREHVHQWTTMHSRIVGNRQLACRVICRVLRHPLLTRLMIEGLSRFPVLASPFIRQMNRGSKLVQGVSL